MSLKSYSKLLDKVQEWRKINPVHLTGMRVAGIHCDPLMFGGRFYENATKDILKNHPRETWDDVEHLKYLSGQLNEIAKGSPRVDMMKHFVTVYDELDRRRGTNWRQLFPEIEKEINRHIIL